jgi:hypothetical protein
MSCLLNYREKRGNPYLTMATGRKLDSLDKKFAYRKEGPDER